MAALIVNRVQGAPASCVACTVTLHAGTAPHIYQPFTARGALSISLAAIHGRGKSTRVASSERRGNNLEYFEGISPESQRQNVAMTVFLCHIRSTVPYLLYSSMFALQWLISTLSGCDCILSHVRSTVPCSLCSAMFALQLLISTVRVQGTSNALAAGSVGTISGRGKHSG